MKKQCECCTCHDFSLVFYQYYQKYMYVRRPVHLEVRYARSFLMDLKSLEYAAREHIYEVVFEKFKKIDRIQDLPELHPLSQDGIFYRFSVDNYMIGIELTGHIVKFLRVLPKPDV